MLVVWNKRNAPSRRIPWPQLVCSRQPSAQIWLMVIMKMVKEFSGGEALIVQPYKMVLGIDPNFIGQTFKDGQELLKHLMRFIQNLAHRACAIGLIDPRIDLVVGL